MWDKIFFFKIKKAHQQKKNHIFIKHPNKRIFKYEE